MSGKLEPIIGHLVVQESNQEFLDKTTQAIKDYTNQGYDVETNYQTSIDPHTRIVIHSAYLVGKLRETESQPLIDSFELGRLEEWVENEYTMGTMPNGAYNTIQELLEYYKKK
ncbi:radical SAM domain-containing protein [Bacillus phage JBP901]|uniref:Uncharacterized protein n=2 Tax=Caeruleovirus TaxID=1911929 RepID=A0A0E3DER0_9CAUD|nr:radical SAM domain-containing protein [Bacillus phage JBP901]YP_009149638.1 radical SAM domain-containing protein [Bacillus phage BCP8-2]AHJ87115.1 hypothetical protein BCP8-2_077 [Bacillus phage BCP8-2]AID17758.1 hypothetical protein JBP901_gp045 [Bacillus phage JBP901]